MRRYTLLRNNQQSGPYTIEDLKAMGLKVYDLIWTEGKSAAWLYAEEIEELAPFTPKIKDIVEESFLEKRATAKIPSILDQLNNHDKAKPVTTYSSTVVHKAEKEIADVVPQNKKEDSLLATETNSNKKNIYAEAESLPAHIIQREELPTIHLEKKIYKEPAVNTQELHSEPSIKYTRSLDDIKQEYVSKMLGKEVRPGKKTVPVLMLLSVGILLLVGVGILIGILLEKNTRQPYPVATIPAQKNIPEKKSSIKETKQTSASKFKEAVAANSYEPNVKPVLPEDEIVNEQPLPKKRVSPGNTPNSANESKTPAKNPSTNTKKEYPQEQKNDVTPVVRKQPEVSRISKKENLRELVHVTSNDYRKAGLFGGLKDVTVTASNNSSHLVDLAVVEVRYVLANGKLFKTDVLYFKNIAPKSSISLKAANSSRGARVESKLTLVTSKSAESISDVSHLAN